MFHLTAALDSVRRKLSTYQALVRAVAQGHIHALMVRGQPGIGKTHEADAVLSAAHAAGDIVYHRAAGHITPLALYNGLYERARQRDVTLFDDVDSVFDHPQSMNILKALTDSRPIRRVTWGSTSGKVSVESYSFAGRIIVLTNHDLAAERFAPLLDRVHYYDLDLKPDEVAARVISVLQAHSDHPHRDAVSQWLATNYPAYGSRLSIRSAIKLLELAEADAGWQAMAEETVVA